MATLALSVAGQFAGGIVGGPIGATIGRALGALAGSAIDSALFGQETQAATPADVRLLGSSEGGVIPRIYGWNRISGNVIWATNLERQSVTTSGSKGMPGDVNEEIVANFALALCEGEVAHIGRIWADGRLLETQGLNFRFHRGTPNQSADSLIVAKQGATNTPAYRGLCYLVFDGLPLSQFGNRIPNISVELCRVVGDLEPAINAITIIPGATEFGYDPETRVRIVGFGATQSENAHLLGQTSDWTLSLDELQALCPNLKHVALVVAWFGDDLRCAQCSVQPRVENATRQIEGIQWMVSGEGRTNVPVMTQYDGGPAYGGSPSDSSVLAAIGDLKARGLNVTLYPFVLMDVAQGNALPDPYNGLTGQPAYPWRGRITCDPAPGVTGSPDKSSALKSQTDAFLGSAIPADFQAGTQTVTYSGAPDWGYRRMILHYARLAAMAGGVDSFLIGSELRGLTWLRNSATNFPFVDGLTSLAADARSILGSVTKLTYAADWSEYSGYHPPDAPGDKLFHLDPLWSDPNIDAVGIDNYMPLSDWRGTSSEPDAAIGSYPQELNYLSANIARGEGFDWYYLTEADRQAGNRTPITDGAHSEPWIWRTKDLVSWWQTSHHNRVGGVRDVLPTSWTPQSKPVWFTELGCAAVDKGTNSPNLFGDPKSSENAAPPFSDGSPDALIQRQFLRAHHAWWQPGSTSFDSANNPVSSVYAGQMLDPERIFVWTWDARPYPAFPMQSGIWSDGQNHDTGHWLTGRLGALASDELIGGMAADYEVSFSALSAAAPLVYGAQITNIVSLRAAVEPMVEATGLILRDTPSGLVMLHQAETKTLDISASEIADPDGPLLVRQGPNHDETIGQLSLTFSDRSRDYQTVSVTASNSLNPVRTSTSTNLILDVAKARNAAENTLRQRQPVDDLATSLPPSMLAVEAGDKLDISGQRDGPFRLTGIRSGELLKVSLRAQNLNNISSAGADVRGDFRAQARGASLPELGLLHLLGEGGDTNTTRLLVGAFADPWPGSVQVRNDDTGEVLTNISTRATMGVLTSALMPAPGDLWDRGSQIELSLYGGHLTSSSEPLVLNGTNRLAIIKDDGRWEVLGFASAQMLSANTYILGNLLRGVQGTGAAGTQTASIGNLVVLVDAALRTIPLGNALLDTSLSLRAFGGKYDLTGRPSSMFLPLDLALPFAPAHLSARKLTGGNDIELRWKRRTQKDGNSWVGTDVPLDFSPETYALDILNGSAKVREITTSISVYVYTQAEQVQDFGSALPTFSFSVRQISAALGAGHPATQTFAA